MGSELIKVEYVTEDGVPDVTEEVIITSSGNEAGQMHEIYVTSSNEQILEEVVDNEGNLSGDEETYYEDTIIASSDNGMSLEDHTIIEEAAEEIVIGSGDVNPDIQTAIDLAKFSLQKQEVNKTPQRYIILQYPNGSPVTHSTPNSLSTLRKVPSKTPSLVVVSDPSGKPKLSYSAMISEVIKAAPAQRLTLNEIYRSISSRYPYYKMDCKNWQNSIRHNLSLNHSFVKVARPENKGRGHFWTIDPSKEKAFKRHHQQQQQHHHVHVSRSGENNLSTSTKNPSRASTTTTTYQILTLSPSKNPPIKASSE